MLTHKIAIYVPSTVNGNQPASQTIIDHWVRKAKTLLSELFGGFTMIPAKGGYYSTTLGLVEEDVTIVQAYADSASLEHLDKVERFAGELAEGMTQEAVSLEIDGTMQFIEPFRLKKTA